MLRQIFVITMEGLHLWRWEPKYFQLTVIIPSPCWHHRVGGGGEGKKTSDRHHWIKRMQKTSRGWSLYSLVFLLTELGQAACFWIFFSSQWMYEPGSKNLPINFLKSSPLQYHPLALCITTYDCGRGGWLFILEKLSKKMTYGVVLVIVFNILIMSESSSSD